jgi:hypothetical protein
MGIQAEIFKKREKTRVRHFVSPFLDVSRKIRGQEGHRLTQMNTDKEVQSICVDLCSSVASFVLDRPSLRLPAPNPRLTRAF